MAQLATRTGRSASRRAIRPVCWHHGDLLWHRLGMLRRLRLRRAETSPPVCKCGEILHLRVMGVGQRWGGEPASAVSCLHCERCGDVEGDVGTRQIRLEVSGPLREHRSLRRRGCRGEEASRPTTQVTQVHTTLLGRGRQSGGKVHCLIEHGCSNGGLLAHVAEDRDLCPGCNQGIGDPIDPNARAPAISALVPCDPLQSEDAVGTRELAEAQCHHAGVRRHIAILSFAADIGLGVESRLCVVWPPVGIRIGLRARAVIATPRLVPVMVR